MARSVVLIGPRISSSHDLMHSFRAPVIGSASGLFLLPVHGRISDAQGSLKLAMAPRAKDACMADVAAEAILLGVAQDGGVPQAGCSCPNCRRAWADPSLRQWVACLGLVDRESRQVWLIDATPDFREQLHFLQERAPDHSLAGIALTHAHSGHYSGLIHLGREVMDASSLPLYATRRMAGFLRRNAPWSTLVEQRNVELRILTPGVAAQLSPHLRLMPVPVPHRDDLSDTLAFVAEGPERRLFYCPDIDGWQCWDLDLGTFLADMDIALLDATFFGANELPHRDMASVPHPLAVETLERLAGIRCEVRLIHLNHTNPLLAAGPERVWLATQPAALGCLGDAWGLG